jgi:hypothetical protein
MEQKECKCIIINGTVLVVVVGCVEHDGGE